MVKNFSLKGHKTILAFFQSKHSVLGDLADVCVVVLLQQRKYFIIVIYEKIRICGIAFHSGWLCQTPNIFRGVVANLFSEKRATKYETFLAGKASFTNLFIGVEFLSSSGLK